jgi:hypothetical protein
MRAQPPSASPPLAIPALGLVVLATACGTTDSQFRADPRTGDAGGVDAGAGDSGNRDTGSADTGREDSGGRDAGVSDAGPGPDPAALRRAVESYCAALRDCDPDLFRSRYGEVETCEYALYDQVTYTNYVDSSACRASLSELLACIARYGECSVYYDEYSYYPRSVLYATASCYAAYESFARDCDAYYGYGYDYDGDGYDDSPPPPVPGGGR